MPRPILCCVWAGQARVPISQQKGHPRNKPPQQATQYFPQCAGKIGRNLRFGCFVDGSAGSSYVLLSSSFLPKTTGELKPAGLIVVAHSCKIFAQRTTHAMRPAFDASKTAKGPSQQAPRKGNTSSALDKNIWPAKHTQPSFTPCLTLSTSNACAGSFLSGWFWFSSLRLSFRACKSKPSRWPRTIAAGQGNWKRSSTWQPSVPSPLSN